MSESTNPEIEGSSYSQEEFDRFLCGIDFKISDGGFFGAKGKFCTSCSDNPGFSVPDVEFDTE